MFHSLHPHFLSLSLPEVELQFNSPSLTSNFKAFKEFCMVCGSERHVRNQFATEAKEQVLSKS